MSSAWLNVCVHTHTANNSLILWLERELQYCCNPPRGRGGFFRSFRQLLPPLPGNKTILDSIYRAFGGGGRESS